MRFEQTLPLKYGDFYSICLFNDRPIVVFSWGRQGNIDWVELILNGIFIILPFSHIGHNLRVAKFEQMLNELILIILLTHLVFLQNLCHCSI